MGHQDILTDDAGELALRERLARQQFYICFTERARRDGDPMADLKARCLALSAPRLTSREIQVCAQKIVMGLRSDAIAHELGLSINTI